MQQLISLFRIENLFGYKNVEIDFDSPYKIIVGENGSGKTTILNCLYYTLKQNFEQLVKIRFDSIKLIFGKNKELCFRHHEVEAMCSKGKNFQSSPFYRSLLEKISSNDIEWLTKVIYSKEETPVKMKRIIAYLNKQGFRFSASSDYMYKNIKRLVDEQISLGLGHRFEILDVLTAKVLYFPTYRRIEAAFGNFEKLLRQVEDDNPFINMSDLSHIFNNELMQFGMSDVKNNINQLRKQISDRTMAGFSTIMGDMLSQLSKTNAEQEQKCTFDKNVIQIILDRLGDRIKPDDKKSIIEYAESNELGNYNLNFLIMKLANLYDEQKELDTAIKKFRDTCNHYLEDKQYVYDESAIDLYIKSSYTGERLDPEVLSSGEKQIVSLFARLYLDIENTFILLFDEPELSLSVCWQEKLMDDIIRSNKCRFMMTVTHSPFIYGERLEKYASGMSEFYK